MSKDSPEFAPQRGARYRLEFGDVPSQQMPYVLRFLADLGIEPTVEMAEAPDPVRATVTPGDFIAASVGFSNGRHSRMTARAFNAAIVYGSLVRPERLPEGYPLEVVEQSDGDRILEGDIALAAEYCRMNGMPFEAEVFDALVQHHGEELPH